MPKGIKGSFTICTVEGCESRAKSKGLCNKHWYRQRRHGHTDTVRIHQSPQGLTDEERFWPKVKKTESCWEWLAGRSAQGYGMFMYGGAITTAHRASYEMFVGPLPQGLQLHHLCENRACVNPEHLEPITAREHTLNRTLGSWSAVNARKTHCPKGHPYAGDNLEWQRNWSGGLSRVCGTCRRQRSQKRALS